MPLPARGDGDAVPAAVADHDGDVVHGRGFEDRDRPVVHEVPEVVGGVGTGGVIQPYMSVQPRQVTRHVTRGGLGHPVARHRIDPDHQRPGGRPPDDRPPSQPLVHPGCLPSTLLDRS